MAKKFCELEAQMSPESQARVKKRTREQMVEMLLSELRRSAGVTQESLATTLGIKQPTLSRMESQDDMQISTLRRVIESLGGELEIIARLPDGDVRLSQFQDVS